MVFNDNKTTRCDSPVKVIKCEDALGKQCKSFSFDDNFDLESELSKRGINDENWSPVAMAGAKVVSLESRVSPLKCRLQDSKTTTNHNNNFNTAESHLLGGLYPVPE